MLVVCYARLLQYNSTIQNHHTAVSTARFCCNNEQQGQWENDDFDPYRSETSENYIT